MKVYLGTDHAGHELKEHVKDWLASRSFAVEDCGAFSLDIGDDYNEFVFRVAEHIAQSNVDRGIIFGGSGQGEAMQANRVQGVRAAVFYGGDTEIVRLSREHNNANILSIGARFVSQEEALRVIQIWLGEPFSGHERHKRRNKKLDELLT
ncbi:MAG: RpiB/LacA/LacB family sugar-phosphate isomerase [Candidatus Spechtbacteria bacterium SB0662_bin_43]|uniref:RpiB/LacA/LacB family sugar-phosphate isomerase n=1 Tax=Candidatus Spechtbacteria bacterium SB0662_bin_43 TaxID=2604897 RepID=A0A845D8R9_9BACT|nr:RpiB/LacA/LacB family sugar-phosphate isomerase [Candidatus Spechtbacteria bacterium SB0662_bin_43]